jgi:hypothetical protein
MKQYCRYCALAIDYDGSLICEANAPCGKFGAGGSYNIEKAKRQNKCKHFEFNSNDLLGQYPDGSFRQYQPREAYKRKDVQAIEAGQTTMFGVNT